MSSFVPANDIRRVVADRSELSEEQPLIAGQGGLLIYRPVVPLSKVLPATAHHPHRRLQGAIVTSICQERTLRGRLASRGAPDCRNRPLKEPLKGP
jgi:hypothetical protein